MNEELAGMTVFVSFLLMLREGEQDIGREKCRDEQIFERPQNKIDKFDQRIARLPHLLEVLDE